MEPSRLGPYTIRGRLGRGGMGTVYEGVDDAGHAVAVKTLSAHLGDDAGLRRRFEAEIAALKALQHPGIVRILAFGEDEGRPFFAMELVRGRSLEEILKSGQRFDWRETAAIAADVTRALKVAHDRGIVHRDLKPANLLFPDEPSPEARVKLADFGIARLFGEAGQTQAGTVVGTAEYMAPEQATGGPVDARVDLYALGLVMFAMLTGRPPFRGGDVTEVLRRQRKEQPPRVSAISAEVPAAVDELVARLLAKDPDDRPPSALAVGRALAALTAAGDDAAVARGRPSAPGTVLGDCDNPTLESGSALRSGVDLLAATRATGSSVAGHAGRSPDPSPTLPFTPASGGDGRSLAHRATQPNRDAEPARPPAASRFTTVEEIHRSAKAAADRVARRDRWLRVGLAAGLLAGVIAGGYVLLSPATADQVHERIRGIADDPAGDLRDARPLIDLFIARFPADPRAAAIRDLDRRLELDALERRARRRPRDDSPPLPIERDYRAALTREAESPMACLAALEAILAVHGGEVATGGPVPDGEPTLWLELVRRQIDRVTPLAARERDEDLTRARATLAAARSLAAEAAAASADDRALLLERRREMLEGLVEIYAARSHLAEPVTEARRLLGAAE